MRASVKQTCLLVSLSVVLFTLTGCETAKFYTQAARGQYEVLSRRKSCDKLIADPNTPAELKGRLVAAAQICDFAEHELKLPAQGDYRRYADLGRPYVVWNVSATPEFSLEAQTWWYPIVGNQGYRGYFTKDAANDSAARLAKQQFDVCVEGIEAYSTLGWFSDPLLNTFIRYGDASLAEILFHEIAHQRVFASGDTDFNEAFATTVGQEGVRRWLRSREEDGLLARYETALRRNWQFVHLVADTRKKLETLYGDKRTASEKIKADTSGKNGKLPVNELRRQKGKIYDELQEGYAQLKKEWGGYSGYDEWFKSNLNNAKLNTVATYYDLVPAFERLLAACDGDLGEFYSMAKRLTTLPKGERHRRLKGFALQESQIAGKSPRAADQHGE